ncbi:MAG: CDP-diacylglycerol--glycerol-3-phosphate 3-phosphatidyltransferase [Acholeplasmatales bacterium]|nr:CDP-diacylglycerol--glycerol-3-phosphate 3-phosphatidyltransferase [Acholeplasmatales bacterium]
MTLPNKLTLLRILLIPVMVIIFYIPWFSENLIFLDVTYLYFFEFIIFFVASVTDFVDGYLARKNNQVTTFGKFLDPLADKMLVFSSMTILLLNNSGVLPEGQPLVPMWVFVVMLIREFMVSGIRMLVSSRGVVIAAGWLGKWKTFITMIAIGALFMGGLHISIIYIGQIFMYIACILTIVSGIEYFWKSRKIILESV